ncbi:MAG: DUF1667 domain-containing protein [Christensenellaceae bacterium]|jgi:CxxC motif-containing protein
MSNTRLLTCINCPLGCQLSVTYDDTQILSITGNQCARGKSYATDELYHPTRTVTCVIPITGRAKPLPVKTTAPVPKDKIFDCLAAIRCVEVSPPIQLGEIILANICNTGIDVIATSPLE